MKKEKEIKIKDMAAPRCAVGERLLFVGEHSQGQEHLGEQSGHDPEPCGGWWERKGRGDQVKQPGGPKESRQKRGPGNQMSGLYRDRQPRP